MDIARIDFTASFLKQYKKAPLKIRENWIRKLEIFKNNPSDLRLNNHPLKGRLLGYKSINITGD